MFVSKILVRYFESLSHFDVCHYSSATGTPVKIINVISNKQIVRTVFDNGEKSKKITRVEEIGLVSSHLSKVSAILQTIF